MNRITKFQLFTAFGNGLPLEVHGVEFAVINKIEREDGSNHNYNVTGVLVNKFQDTTVFVQTLD